MLRLVLVEYAALTIEKLNKEYEQANKAKTYYNELVRGDMGSRTTLLAKAKTDKNFSNYGLAHLELLIQHSHENERQEYYNWFESLLRARNVTAELVKNEMQLESSENKTSLANVIGTVKMLSNLRWESVYEQLSYVENVYLKENAICQCGYAELSDGSYQGTYHYYLDGEGADAKIRMAVLSKEQEQKHYEVLIQHNQPHTFGQMDNYGVVKDQGKLVIDGIGTITKGQHGSAAHQTNKIMVFDANCIASANPYLYIDEYDVKASHAAGVGKMDEDHLYYLQSRGLSKKQAMHLITYGYLKPVIEVIDNEMLKERFEEALSKVGD